MKYLLCITYPPSSNTKYKFSYELEGQWQIHLTLFLRSPFFIKDWIWSWLELTYQNTSKSIILVFSTFISFWSCLIGAAAEFLVFCALSAILLAGGQRDNSTYTLRSHIINIYNYLATMNDFIFQPCLILPQIYRPCLCTE